MPNIILQKFVKYNGQKIPANTIFEVAEKDLKEFIEKGCHIFEEAKEVKEKIEDIIEEIKHKK